MREFDPTTRRRTLPGTADEGCAGDLSGGGRCRATACDLRHNAVINRPWAYRYKN